MSNKNDVTGDVIKTKNSNSAYSEGWDRIFGNKEVKEDLIKKDPLEALMEESYKLGLYDMEWDNHFIDPPLGWRYGFPKKYSVIEHKTFRNLLLTSGYPESDIEFALQNMRILGK
jgi:hypothetical protein